MAIGEIDEANRILMCEPLGFGVHHVLNAWMKWDETVDLRRAVQQWEALGQAIESAGGTVEVMPHEGRSGAMTFTRDTAVVTAPGRATLLRNHGRRGDLEPEHIGGWLRQRGFDVDELADDVRIDGGNVVPTTDGWLIGIPIGTSAEAVRGFARTMRARTGAMVHGVPIIDLRYGHLDTALSDLAGHAWLAHAAALGRPDLSADVWGPIFRGRPVVEATTEEAEALACNVIVIDRHVIGGLSVRLCREIEKFGLEAVPVGLDEFRKAGGGAHCLTLELDPIHAPEHPLNQPDQSSTKRRIPCLVP